MPKCQKPDCELLPVWWTDSLARDGFFSTFFRDLGGKVEFLEQTLQWPCFDDTAWTYCDVERVVQRLLR